MSRILLTTWGSLGDLHPMLAVALGLRDRGHEIVLATNEDYRTKIESLGLGFHAIRPNIPEDPQLIEKLMDAKISSKLILKDILLDNVRDMYDDLIAIVNNANFDFLVAHEIAFAAPLVAEVLGLRWASFSLSPGSFISAYEPIMSSAMPALAKLYKLGPGINRWAVKFVNVITQPWGEQVYQFRRSRSLRPIQNPFIGHDKHSPYLVLALFSSVFGTPQPDWPPNVVTTGFTFYDGNREQQITPELQTFLDSGDPPLVFTLGSSAVYAPGDFYVESVQTAIQMDRRAVLLIGNNPPPENLPANIFTCDYVPHSAIFPHACAIVHPGGIGTTAQGLQSGIPTLVVPFANDQFDNAARLERLGVSRTIQRNQYRADRVAKELRKLLEDPHYKAIAEEVREIVQTEDGVGLACDAIEKQLVSQI